jgi:PAS domain S-box-containing protein
MQPRPPRPAFIVRPGRNRSLLIGCVGLASVAGSLSMGQHPAWSGDLWGLLFFSTGTVLILAAAGVFSWAELDRMRGQSLQTSDTLRATLKEVEDLKTALDEHAIVAITDPQGRITFVNDKFCAISHYTREELIGQDHRIINSGYHSKAFIRDLWGTIGRGRVWNGEIRNRAKTGSYYWVATTIVPFLDEQGKPRQYVAIRADITERKEAEQALREAHDDLELKVARRTAELQAAKERAESADRLKSEFLATMSHELRTPLNGIIGFTELLVAGRPGPLTAKQNQYLGEVLASGRHLLHLINDVLDLSKVEAGKVELFPERFPVQTLVDEVCASLSMLSEQKHLTVSRHLSPDPLMVTLDRRRLVQVLYNLVSNAIKFTPPQGHVEIHGAHNAEGRLHLEVRDTGIGIKAEDFPKLFVEFQQLDSGVNRRYQGTGLGLALTRKIVEFQGGTITFTSKVGVGTTFIVELPISSP